MYYVTKKLLSKLPEDAQSLVEEQGIPYDEFEAMSDDEKEALANEEGVEGDEYMEDMTPRDESNSKPASVMKYGDSGEFVDEVDEEGNMKPYSEKKKKSIPTFDDAEQRGLAYIDAMNKKGDSKKDMAKKMLKKSKPVDKNMDDEEESEM